MPKAVKLCIQHAGEVQSQHGSAVRRTGERFRGTTEMNMGLRVKMSRMQGCARDHEIV